MKKYIGLLTRRVSSCESLVNIRKQRSVSHSALAVFTLTAFPLVSFGWQTGTPPKATCLVTGQVFGLDILEHTISLKGDAGSYFDVHFDDSTIFSDGKAVPSKADLNIDDRVCVEALREKSSIASAVLVIERSQIDGRNKSELVEWDRDTYFGTLQSLDIDKRRIVLRTAGGSDVPIEAAGPVEFWTLPAESLDPADAVSIDWAELNVGESLYVRGNRAPGAGAVNARLIVPGGFRSLVGSLESIHPLTEMFQLRDFRSGRSQSIHFDFARIYVVAGTAETTERHLYAGTVGDLTQGDSVLILARQDRRTGRIDTLLMITGFARSGMVRSASGQSPDWILKASGLGGQSAPP